MFESIDQIENAKKIYEEGIFNNPNNFSLRNNFGKLLNSEKKYIEAITHLEKAYKINSNSSIYWNAPTLSISNSLYNIFS